jgi:hypothetical protein
MGKLYKAIQDKDNGVFKCPVIQNKDISEFKLVNTYFVDNSGLGDRGEVALIASDFLSQVKKDYYYGITSIGQFQVYIGEYVKA